MEKLKNGTGHPYTLQYDKSHKILNAFPNISTTLAALKADKIIYPPTSIVDNPMTNRQEKIIYHIGQ